MFFWTCRIMIYRDTPEVDRHVEQHGHRNGASDRQHDSIAPGTQRTPNHIDDTAEMYGDGESQAGSAEVCTDR